jgi:hypothetical protein
MALSAGTRIGSYEVTAQIGGAAWGEVNRTLNSNLGRQVAIEILPDAFAVYAALTGPLSARQAAVTKRTK